MVLVFRPSASAWSTGAFMSCSPYTCDQVLPFTILAPPALVSSHNNDLHFIPNSSSGLDHSCIQAFAHDCSTAWNATPGRLPLVSTVLPWDSASDTLSDSSMLGECHLYESPSIPDCTYHTSFCTVSNCLVIFSFFPTRFSYSQGLLWHLHQHITSFSHCL